jgi:hypothetical protein
MGPGLNIEHGPPCIRADEWNEFPETVADIRVSTMPGAMVRTRTP